MGCRRACMTATPTRMATTRVRPACASMTSTAARARHPVRPRPCMTHATTDRSGPNRRPMLLKRLRHHPCFSLLTHLTRQHELMRGMVKAQLCSAHQHLAFTPAIPHHRYPKHRRFLPRQHQHRKF